MGGGGEGGNDKRWGENFQVHISPKRREIDMWILLDFNRNSYMESPTAPLHLTLSNLQKSNSRSLTFQSLLSRNGAELGLSYY